MSIKLLHSDLWIFGDNILECERALRLVADAVGVDIRRIDSQLFAPAYEGDEDDVSVLSVRLFPGYGRGRWGFDPKDRLRADGARLREATDAVIFDASTAHPILALEFCGALPAGNQAWQRSGRALACADAGVPYLYYAELGGIELDALRQPKAPRLPNPIVPFAYLALSEMAESLAAPVFGASATISISPALGTRFGETYGDEAALRVIRSVIVGDHSIGDQAVHDLQQRAVSTIGLLADLRRTNDALTPDQWASLASCQSPAGRLSYLLDLKMPWKKLSSIETLGLPDLLRAVADLGVVAAGASTVPISLLPGDSRPALSSRLQSLHGDLAGGEFLSWLERGEARPLVMVWLAGFKPGGDDSRPDRGLLPLARMLFGDAADYLAVIYGPATPGAWQQFATDMGRLAETNGFWEAVVGLSDAIYVVSKTATALPAFGWLTPVIVGATETNLYFDPDGTPRFGEHDVDTVLHTLFSSDPDSNIFEGMCNPPGGDWSGVSFQTAAGEDIYRWSSLPRVTKSGHKRPDHIVIFQDANPTVLSIESKENASAIEPGVGVGLSSYVQELIKSGPLVVRATNETTWRAYIDKWHTTADYLSAAACVYAPGLDLEATRERARTDLLLALEFADPAVIIHAKTSGKRDAEVILGRAEQLALKFPGRIEIQKH